MSKHLDLPWIYLQEGKGNWQNSKAEGDDVGVVAHTCSTWFQWSNGHLGRPLKPNCKPGESPKLPEAVGYLNRRSSGTRAEGCHLRAPRRPSTSPGTLPPRLRREPATKLQPQEDSHSLGRSSEGPRGNTTGLIRRDNVSFSVFLWLYLSLLEYSWFKISC